MGRTPYKLRLTGGVVGDYDGAYAWVRDEDYDKPENAVGNHPDDGLNYGYYVVEVNPEHLTRKAT